MKRDAGLEPRRYSDARLKLFRLCEGTARRLGGRAFYRRRFLSRRRLRVRHETVVVSDWSPRTPRLRLVQLSDLHAGPFLAEGDLGEVCEVARELAPDLYVLTGDLISERTEEAFTLIEDLAGLRAPLGSFAVFGNHDYRGRREGEIVQRLGREAGWQFLRNEGQRFDHHGEFVHLTGLEDLEEAKRVDPDAARAELEPADTEILLVHNPGFADGLLRGNTRLVLSGHSHGHQIDLPYVRRFAPRHPGDRLERGPAVCLTSRGLGALGLPLRIASPAELVCIDLVPADAGAGLGLSQEGL